MPDRRKRYDWDKVVVGTWQNWIDCGRDSQISDQEARRQAQNIVVAAREWANRNGLRVHTRRVRNGRILDLLFVHAEG